MLFSFDQREHGAIAVDSYVISENVGIVRDNNICFLTKT